MAGQTIIKTRAEFSGIPALKSQWFFFSFGLVANLLQVGVALY
jgi:hypothetical protein